MLSCLVGEVDGKGKFEGCMEKRERVSGMVWVDEKKRVEKMVHVATLFFINHVVEMLINKSI